jgi:pyridoxamine 5'-phosphate oxidase
MSIASIRRDYQLKSLSEQDILSDPLQQFTIWWKEALTAEIDEVNAMTLSTAKADGRPTARIVLLKGYDENGFVFFTNYDSHKGQELINKPFASLLFFWKELERQVRIEGICEKISPEESDAYFYSRPLGSRFGAWASPQSQVIPNRELLEKQAEELTIKYSDGVVPRPPHWGGFRVVPDSIELWQGRSNRLHDRILYTKDSSNWDITRLAP